MANCKPAIVEWAKWAVANKAHFNYTEGAQRMTAIGVFPPKFPMFADCSAFVTWCYWVAGAPDPNGLGYNHEGYTGTLLGHGTEIPLQLVEPGDVIVYGPSTGWHTALCISGGPDPLTISHGQQGDPSIVKVSQDGRQPQRYLRFSTEGTLRTPQALEVHKVATPDLNKVAAPQPVADTTHLQTAPQVHQTAPEAPQTAPAPTPAPAHPEQQFAPTSPATIGWPLLKEIEHIAHEVIKGPDA